MNFSVDFLSARNTFREEIEVSLSAKTVENIKKKFDEIDLQPTNKRSALDQALRESLISMLTDVEQGVEEYRQFLDVCLAICRNEMAIPVLSVTLLSDIFDSSTIEVCEELFIYVEENVSTWKEPLFFSNCKNNILRMCNDLLRRLSRSQNTIFCGRILLFLAMFFPFSERSGLNIVSEFNLENETEYDKEPLDEPEDVDNVSDITIKIDYNFYVKFWSLQDFFRNPNQCYNSEHWNGFVENTKSVLHVFKHYKVEADPTETAIARNEETHFFAKFLTSQKLLILQVNDVHFRRTIYLQFLIIFQYLNANVKSKPEGCELTAEQIEWANETTKFIHNLIKETPPDGEWFLKVVLLELERDDYWSDWKNEGCPALKQASTSNIPVTGFRSRRPLGQIVKESRTSGKLTIAPGKKDERPIVLNVNPDLLNKCKLRGFMPDLQERFEEIAQQADPAAMIEPQYKKLNSFHYGWSSLRVLAAKSSLFYGVSNKPVSKLPDYLELMSKRILRDRLIKELAAQVRTENKDTKEESNQVGEKGRIEKVDSKENGESVGSFVEQNNYDDAETKDSKGTEEENGNEDIVEEKDYSNEKEDIRGNSEEEREEEEEVEEVDSNDDSNRGESESDNEVEMEEDYKYDKRKDDKNPSDNESYSEDEESEEESEGQKSSRSEKRSDKEEIEEEEEIEEVKEIPVENSDEEDLGSRSSSRDDDNIGTQQEATKEHETLQPEESKGETKVSDEKENEELPPKDNVIKKKIDEENNLEEGEVKDDDSDIDLIEEKKSVKHLVLKFEENYKQNTTDEPRRLRRVTRSLRIKETKENILEESKSSGGLSNDEESQTLKEEERLKGEKEGDSKESNLGKRGCKRKTRSSNVGRTKKIIVEESNKEILEVLRKRSNREEFREEEDTNLNGNEEKDKSKRNILKDLQLDDISKNISSKWQQVAERLGFKQNEIENFSSENKTEEERAKSMLDSWVSKESGTEEILKECLKPLGLLHAMDFVLSKT